MASDLNVTRIEYISGDEENLFGNDSYTVSLLHMDGADASTTFTESASNGTHTWTASGNAQIDTAQSRFGGAAGLFDGSGDYIQTPYSADFDFGTGDFTVDLWVRFNALPGSGATQVFLTIARMTDNNNVNTFYLNNAAGVYRLYFTAIIGGTAKAQYYNTTSWSVATATWYHLAAVRNGSNVYIFINGVSQGLTAGTAIGSNSITPAVNEATTIGRYGNYTLYDFNGWLDEFRISKGIARWTSNFLPPPRPYGIDGEIQAGYVSIQNFISAIDSLESVSDAPQEVLADCILQVDKVNAVDPTAVPTGNVLLDKLMPTRTEKVTMPDPAGLAAGNVLLDHMEPTRIETIANSDVQTNTLLDHLEPVLIETVTESDLAPQSLLPTLIISIFDALQANEIYSPILDTLLIQAQEAIDQYDSSSPILDLLLVKMADVITNNDLPASILSNLLIQLLEAIDISDLSPQYEIPYWVVQMLETVGLSESFLAAGENVDQLVQMIESLVASDPSTTVINPLIIQAADAITNLEISQEKLAQLIVNLFETITNSDALTNTLLEELAIRILETITGSDLTRIEKEYITLRAEFLFNRFGRTAPSVTAGGNFKFAQNKTESPSRTAGGNFKYKKPKDN